MGISGIWSLFSEGHVCWCILSDMEHSPALERYMLRRLLEYTQSHKDGFTSWNDVVLVLWLV